MGAGAGDTLGTAVTLATRRGSAGIPEDGGPYAG